MPRYLSAEWVAQFNDALAGLNLTDAVAQAGAGSLAASEGAFAVAQVVTGTPDGTDVRTVLRVADGHASLELELELVPSDTDGATEGSGGSPRCNVTIILGYTDALAMARGELNPADALAAGQVRVRGELAVLVAGQSVLAAAAEQLGTTLADLTD
jgi:hypothetical protein